MNKNINVEDCSLTNVYKTYPRASWPYAFSCSNRCENIFNEIGRNTVCHNVVYVAKAHFHSDCNKDMDKLDWIRNQEDIVELDRRLYNRVDKDRNPKYIYVFQFVLGDEMVKLHSKFLRHWKQKYPRISEKLFNRTSEITKRVTFTTSL